MDNPVPHPQAVEPLIVAMSQQLQALLPPHSDPAMIGIHTGGVWVAKRLHQLLQISTPLGQLGITFYRDDFTQIGMHPEVKPSAIDFEVDNRTIILVDDVLHTGRTIRAALNEIFDFGRPAAIILAVLIERGGRELPIQANVVGRSLHLTCHQQVRISGPDPLMFSILNTKT